MNNNTKRRIWLTLEQQLEAIKRYTEGESPDKIADSFGVCANNIRSTLRKHNVKIRDRSEAQAKCEIWKEAFDEITPESAYWLGFLFADGSVYKRPSGADVLTVALAEKDRGHLEKFRTFLKSTHTISDKRSTIRGKTFPLAQYIVRSEHLTDALKRHGMRQKSLERIAPDYLCASRDFWRGMVDGDGFVNVEDLARPRIGLYGGKTLMTQFLGYLRNLNIAKTTEVHEHKSSPVDEDRQASRTNIYNVAFVCGPAASTIYLLYKDACVALDRKYERVKTAIESPGWRNRQTPET